MLTRSRNFPSFSEGLSLRVATKFRHWDSRSGFPFLFGGTFIEGRWKETLEKKAISFPFLFGGTFIEGPRKLMSCIYPTAPFPFLFGGTFIEGSSPSGTSNELQEFPFLFGGTFIEGPQNSTSPSTTSIFPFLFGGTFIEGSVNAAADKAGTFNFPSFSEGLSLRDAGEALPEPTRRISLPFRRDFH